MATEDQERLARALDALAAQIASAPRSVVGMKVSAVAGPGSSGNVTGMKVSVTGGPGGGNVTGLHLQATAGPDPAVDLIRELREAATAARQNGGHKGWVQSLLQRAQSLTDRVIDTALVTGLEQAIGAVFK